MGLPLNNGILMESEDLSTILNRELTYEVFVVNYVPLSWNIVEACI